MIKSLTKRELVILSSMALVAFCGLMGVDIHIASLPHIMRYMHTDETHMQQSVSIFLLGLGVSILVYGPLSDKYGRKPIVIFGLGLASIASVSSVFTHQINIFLITRFFQGAGSGVCIGLGRTIIADILQGRQLALTGAYFSTAVSLSPLLAPPLGGYLQNWFDWQANFVFLALFLLLTLFIFVLFCPETNQHKNPDAFRLKTIGTIYASLLTHKVFMVAVLLASIGMTAPMVYATVSSIIFQEDFHITSVQYGWVSMSIGAASMGAKLIAPTLLMRFGSQGALKKGLWLFIIGGGWILFVSLLNKETVLSVVFGVMVVMLAMPLILPTTLSYALSPFHLKRGAAGSIYGSLPLLFAFLFTSILSLFSHSGVIIIGVAYCLLGVLGLLIFYIGRQHLESVKE